MWQRVLVCEIVLQQPQFGKFFCRKFQLCEKLPLKCLNAIYQTNGQQAFNMKCLPIFRNFTGKSSMNAVLFEFVKLPHPWKRQKFWQMPISFHLSQELQPMNIFKTLHFFLLEGQFNRIGSYLLITLKSNPLSKDAPSQLFLQRSTIPILSDPGTMQLNFEAKEIKEQAKIYPL